MCCHSSSVGIQGRLGEARDQAALTMTAEGTAGCVSATADGIDVPFPLLDQVIVERRTTTRRCCRVALARPAPESMDTMVAPRGFGRRIRSRTLARDLGPAGVQRIDALTSTDGEVVGEAAAVRVECPRRQP